VLFNHGMDPTIGDKPLGKPRTMKEDSQGLFVEVPLDDTSYNRDIIASLKSGALDGMSFRMSVIRDEWDKLDTDLPERTIQEIRLYEFGPVTFPAYKATEAGVRAHAPEAFAAFRAQQLAASGPVYTYTPSEWPGFSIAPDSITTSATSSNITLYVRDEEVPSAPIDDIEPEDRVEDDPVEENDIEETSDVESEVDTMNAPDDSVDPDPSSRTTDDPVDSDPSPAEDDPSESAPSSPPKKRMSLMRKTLLFDETSDRLQRELARAQRYSDLD
jgi:HK97 family phage prohead protease